MAFGRPKKLKEPLSKALAHYWAEYMPLGDKAPDVITQDRFMLSYSFGRCRIDPKNTDDWNLRRAKTIFANILNITKQLPGKKRAKLVIEWTEGGAVGNTGLRHHVAIGETTDRSEECDTVNSVDSWMRRHQDLAHPHSGVSWYCEIRSAF